MLLLVLAVHPLAAAGELPKSSYELTLDGPAEGLVGNGRSVVIATPWGFRYHRGGSGEGSLQLTQNGRQIDLRKLTWKTTAFPGGVLFTHEAPGGGRITVFHTALADDPYGMLVRLAGEYAGADLTVQGGPKLQAHGGAGRTLGFSETGKIAAMDFDQLHAAVLAPYLEHGLVLRSPDPLLDQTVLFNQYLLDLSYNGRMIVCELFRWADIWSRDLGSGFVPGALVTNRVEPARQCIDVDLARHEKATARALKTTGDASQGGSAEGVSHLTNALWEYYLVTGDKTYLARVAEGLRPWVEAWLARDYAHRGLIIDTTDWMDHSRNLMLPFGSATLYANAQMVRLLGTFARIEAELGHAPAASRYTAERSRFVAGINDRLWSEKLGCYANLLAAGQQDERTASAANSLALLGGVADPGRTAAVLATLKARNWRPAGTLTITPRMTYEPDNDQNEKIWPWWVAYEAMARSRNGDPDGGLRLLDNCAATIRDAKYPGMMAETLSADGRSEGGRAFATAAGAFLSSVCQGLFGIDILVGGMGEVRITPHLPAAWKDASLHQSTPGGSIDIDVRDRVPHITVRDPRIKVVHTTFDAFVVGAEKKVWADPTPPPPRPDVPFEAPPLVARQAGVFEEPGFPSTGEVSVDPMLARIGWAGLSGIDAGEANALVVRGNTLPYATPEGKPLRDVLDRFLNRGGQIVFLGAAMRPNNTRNRSNDPAGLLGSEGGVIEWYGRQEQRWVPVHPRTGHPETAPKRDGTVYWGNGDYFGGWDAARGAFGFAAKGRGVRVPADSPLARTCERVDAEVAAVFTDFAVSSPWYFQTLATTHTEYNYLLPARGEDLPCVVRLTNRDTHGEIVLVGRGAESRGCLASLLRPAGAR